VTNPPAAKQTRCGSHLGLGKRESGRGGLLRHTSARDGKREQQGDEAALKATGARGVIIRGNGVQVIYGPHVTIIKNEVEEILS
jgi:hypothetical protein